MEIYIYEKFVLSPKRTSLLSFLCFESKNIVLFLETRVLSSNTVVALMQITNAEYSTTALQHYGLQYCTALTYSQESKTQYKYTTNNNDAEISITLGVRR